MNNNKNDKKVSDFKFSINKHVFIFCPLIFFCLLITRSIGRTYEFGSSLFNERIYSYNLISVFLSMGIYMVCFIVVWFYSDHVCSNRSIMFKILNVIIYYIVSFIVYLTVNLYQLNFGFSKSNYPYYVDKLVFLLPIVCFAIVIIKYVFNFLRRKLSR